MVGSWVPDRAILTPVGIEFVRGLRGKLIAVSALRCDGNDASAPVSSVDALRLSADRAAVVCASVKRLGGIRAPTEIVGHGASHPIASNATEARRARNRRVEVELTHRADTVY